MPDERINTVGKNKCCLFSTYWHSAT